MRKNVVFPDLDLFLSSDLNIADRISAFDGVIEIDCYAPKEKWDAEAWEEHKILVKPRVLTRESFKEAYRIARIITKAFKSGVDAVVPTRTRAGGDIEVELRQDAPFRINRGTAVSAGWLMQITNELTSVLSENNGPTAPLTA